MLCIIHQMGTAMWLVNANVSQPNSADVVCPPFRPHSCMTDSAFQQSSEHQHCRHEFCFASPLGLPSPALQHRSAATPQLRSVWDVWGLGMQVDKSSNLLEISPIILSSTNLETENEIKWSSRKGNYVCHILSLWLHGVVLYLDWFCFATERLKPLVMYELWIWQYWHMYFILARWSTKCLGSTGPDRCRFGTGFMSRSLTMHAEPVKKLHGSLLAMWILAS